MSRPSDHDMYFASLAVLVGLAVAALMLIDGCPCEASAQSFCPSGST